MIGLSGFSGQAQNTNQHVVVNTGLLFVSPNEIVATQFDFANTEQAKLINDGTIYYYRNFNNEGYYSFSNNRKTSKVVFSRYSNEEGTQLISGNALTDFFDLELNNATPKIAFDLKNNIAVYGTLDFKKGIIKVDEYINPIHKASTGMVSFMPQSQHVNVSDQSHVEGEVEKIGKEPFTYPVGDKNRYRPAMISAPKDIKDAITAKYNIDEASFFENHKATTGVIKQLNTAEYWKLEGKLKTPATVILSLTWDEHTTVLDLLKDPENELHIVRWDEKQQLWVDEGGVVDMSSRTVTTPAEIKDFGYFTLATVKTDFILEGDVVIYNLVTPDGDGKNDYFIIDNIRKYPNNRVEIYNRWGVKVYETTNYDPLGDGSTNVFTGYSEGKVTIDKKKKLPSGTYYYVVTYEYKDANGSRMIKKAANLHLENK
ncbi:gliding motility-associated C-terminal domain-containing protein [Myroides odoratus]|uniref:gliding motility-associated C-terminal domain-containing protein n=1 Tax=Myroides odoratus TaxID=256 RepID=UPI0039B08C13